MDYPALSIKCDNFDQVDQVMKIIEEILQIPLDPDDNYSKNYRHRPDLDGRCGPYYVITRRGTGNAGMYHHCGIAAKEERAEIYSAEEFIKKYDMEKTLTKQQALDQIEQLRKYIESLETVIDGRTLNVVTQWPAGPGKSVLQLNTRWAATIYASEEQGYGRPSKVHPDRRASMFLPDCDGQWYDQDGKPLRGYLFFEPKNKTE